jgi:hypothetical protein
MHLSADPANPTPPTIEKKLALLQKLRDELGSGDTIRRLFFGDLQPLHSNQEELAQSSISITKLRMSPLLIVQPTMYFWLPD